MDKLEEQEMDELKDFFERLGYDLEDILEFFSEISKMNTLTNDTGNIELISTKMLHDKKFRAMSSIFIYLSVNSILDSLLEEIITNSIGKVEVHRKH